MSNRDTTATLEYHETTKHSERSVRTSRHFLDFENQPLAFKIYRDLEAIPLPQSFPGNDVPALEAISSGVAAPAAEGDDERTPDLASLSRILYLSAGFSPHAAGKSVMFLVALGHPDRAALGLKM